MADPPPPPPRPSPPSPPRSSPPSPPQSTPPSAPPFWRRPAFWATVAALLIANWLLGSLFLAPPSRLQVPYTEFQSQLTAGNVESVTSKGETIQGEFHKSVTYPKASADRSTLFQTQRPSYAKDDLLKVLEAEHVTVNAKPITTAPSFLTEVLVGFGPTLLLIGGFLWLSRRATSGLSSMGGFGRSRAKRYDASKQRTTFADVAGVDEVKDELAEVVDFLRNPSRYRRLGATIPKGVLLSGPPGTGKTLLARAVAGEAGVPFFSVSASEFVEMIVGVGASRVRDLFVEAKGVAPAIVFIDELDGIGQSRTSGGSFGANDEREQTLNQILTEMDGFSGTEGVIVLGATNRPEVLDPALLRPGRFDRRVTVNPPDLAGRAAILRVHTRGVPLAPGVDLTAIASQTPGMVGADLRNLVNEAALLSARRRRERVGAADFTDALEKLVLGAARRIVLSPDERERSAYHESGHALLGMLQPGADPVRKVSIVPRGRALGVTFQSADADRYAYEEPYLRGNHRRARWPRRRAARVRARDHRRRVRPRAGHGDRPPDGGALGHERRRGADNRPVRTWRAPPAHGGRPVARHPAAGRRRGSPHRRRLLRGGARPAERQPGAARQPRPHPAGPRDPRRGRRLPGSGVPGPDLTDTEP
jgi:cell division protease FtsH